MRIVFMGTGEFAVPILRAVLQSQHELVAIYTQPDRPRGRGKKTSLGVIQSTARDHKVPVLCPVSLRTTETTDFFQSHRADLVVVASYGLLLPQSVLDMPRWGCINIHASLLPRWRGAAPIAHALRAGDAQTGVTIQKMVAALDAGDVLGCTRTSIEPDDHCIILRDRLAQLGAHLLCSLLSNWPQALGSAHPQDLHQVTYALKINKTDAQLNWNASAPELERCIRAYWGWPVAYAYWQGRRIRFWKAVVCAHQHTQRPVGTVSLKDRRLHVQCGRGCLILESVQQENGRIVSGLDWSNAHVSAIKNGSKFEFLNNA